MSKTLEERNVIALERIATAMENAVAEAICIGDELASIDRTLGNIATAIEEWVSFEAEEADHGCIEILPEGGLVYTSSSFPLGGMIYEKKEIDWVAYDNKTLLVPGVPEAGDQKEGAE